MFKAYCFEQEFKKLIDSGQFAFVDRHLILNDERYVIRDQAGNAMLSEYARSHVDECGVVFTKGYCYQSKYKGSGYYSQFMRSSVPVENQVKYSFELNLAVQLPLKVTVLMRALRIKRRNMLIGNTGAKHFIIGILLGEPCYTN